MRSNMWFSMPTTQIRLTFWGNKFKLTLVCMPEMMDSKISVLITLRSHEVENVDFYLIWRLVSGCIFFFFFFSSHTGVAQGMAKRIMLLWMHGWQKSQIVIQRKMSQGTHFQRAQEKIVQKFFARHNQPNVSGDDMNIIQVGRPAVSRYHQQLKQMVHAQSGPWSCNPWFSDRSPWHRAWRVYVFISRPQY